MKKKQFTLIELIIVIVVIGLLAAMALPKVTGVVKDARISAMIHDKDVLEKIMILHYQKYDNLPLLNEGEDFIVLNDNLSLVKLVQAEETKNEDMKTIQKSLQETLNHYEDSEDNLYRIDLSKIKDSLGVPLKYGYKKTDMDFYVFSTKTNNVYYYDHLVNQKGTIQHDEYDTLIKEEENEEINKIKSPILDMDGIEINNKPIVEITTDLEDLNVNSIIEWQYMFTDENEKPAKISFILNDVEYDSFDKIPTKLTEGTYTIRLRMQDNRGIWSDEITTTFEVDNYVIKESTLLDLGDWHSLFVKSDENLYAWGRNTYGQLGIGNTINQTTPQKVNLPSVVKVKSVYTGESHSMMVDSNDNLYAWGQNTSGQLGLGNTSNQNTPQKVTLPNGVKPTHISLGANHSIILGNDNNLYVSGANSSGQLGIGNTTNQSKFVKVSLPTGVSPKIIFARRDCTMIIGNDDNLYAWGNNSSGQLGIGNTTNQTKPQKVTLPNGVIPKYISLGYHHSIVAGDDENFYSCGSNSYGELGLGSSGSLNSTYKKISLPNGVKTVSASLGYMYTMFIGSDGNLYSCGMNNFGQVGVGNKTTQTTVQKVILPNNDKPKRIIAGGSYAMVIGQSGVIYATGENTYGQLGIGNLTHQQSFIKISI